MIPLVDDTPGRVLAVYAHPDDPEIAAGGTLARWAAAGSTVWVLITTRGDKGAPDDPDIDPDALATRRVAETAAAAKLLGFAGHFHLDYPDGELPDDLDLRAAIVRRVRELRPEVVLCPDPTAVFFGDTYFNHRDHRVTGWAALDAVAPAARGLVKRTSAAGSSRRSAPRLLAPPARPSRGGTAGTTPPSR